MHAMLALIELVTLGGTGVLLMLAALLMRMFQMKKIKACSQTVSGQVVEHSFPGHNKLFPVVRYSVDGTEYLVKRSFAGFVTEQKVTPKHMYADRGAYISARGYLHVPVSAFTNLKHMADTLWPIGSSMTVYYNPQNPKQAYAEEKPEWMPLEQIGFLVAGGCTVLISVVLCVVILAT